MTHTLFELKGKSLLLLYYKRGSIPWAARMLTLCVRRRPSSIPVNNHGCITNRIYTWNLFIFFFLGINLDLHICEFSNTECYTIWEKANWTNANNACVRNKGKILYSPSYLIGKIVKTNYGGKYYWTDYRRENNSERFRSVEGNYLPDSFSHHGKENHSLDGSNCMAFDVERREFLSLDCNSENVVVCEIGKYILKEQITICTNHFHDQFCYNLTVKVYYF